MTTPDIPWTSRRRFLAQGACCGLGVALGSFALAGTEPAPTAPSHWPEDARTLWQRAWQGLRPEALADVHVHLLGHTGEAPDDDAGAWIHPRTLSPLALGDWVRRLAIESAAGVAGHRAELSRRYLERLAALWDDFPAGARPLLLAFDAVVDAQGRVDVDRTMFRTGNAYAREAARARGWGWIASVHPDRADAIDRLQAAHAQGARAVKWLPSAMDIDPSRPRYRRYYAELARLKLPLLTHAGEEKAVTGAQAHEAVNPLLLRHPLGEGVRVVLAHCASLGHAVDLDDPRKPKVDAFSLFARLMDDRSTGALTMGDVSAVTQVNREPVVLRTLLERDDWHARLLYGSDYPLPGLGWLTSPAGLADAGLLQAEEAKTLKALQPLNPLAFDFVLKRTLRWRGRGFADAVFASNEGLSA